MVESELAEQQHQLMERFAEAAREALCGDENLEVQVSLLDARPPLNAPEQDPEWLQTVQSAMEELQLPEGGQPGALTSDAGHLQRNGVPSVVFGPGRAADMFTNDESVCVAELERALEFYEAMIRRWCT